MPYLYVEIHQVIGGKTYLVTRGPEETGRLVLGALFRDMRKEYGRCIGKVRIDTKNEEGMPVGWVFEKAIGGRGPGFRVETWVTVFRQVKPLQPAEYKRVKLL